MSYYCAVCNGLESASVTCPKCAGEADDCGKVSDFLGPYAPYRAIDDYLVSGGLFERQQASCLHIMYCPSCGHQFELTIYSRES